MNTRAWGAIVRRDLLRGRKWFMVTAGATGVGVLLALLLPAELSLIASMFSIVSVFGIMAPSAMLGADKLQGFLEADRTLPVSSTLVATARLAAAALMILPVGIGLLPLLIGIHRTSSDVNPVLLFVAPPIMAIAIGWLVSWALLAYNARWSLRGLRFVVPFLAVGPQVLLAFLPPGAKAVVTDGMTAMWGRLLAVTTSPVGVAALLVFVLAFPVIYFMGAALVFASGLDRYVYDPTAINAMMSKAPRRELAALGRGAILAVARLRLRLSVENVRNQLLMLGVFVLLLFVGPQELRTFARMYVRMIALFLPAGIAGQLSVARQKGYLEGIQHLPQMSSSIAFGHLLAIAALTTPGMLCLLIADASTGARITLTGVVSSWGWFVAAAWIAAVAALWFKKRHVLILLGLLAALLAASALNVDLFIATLTPVVDLYSAAKARAGIAIPIAALALSIGIGVPLFSRALTRYQFRGV